MADPQNIRKWIENMPKNGQNSFTLDELFAEFPDANRRAVAALLWRLSNKKIILGVKNGFYAFVPVEYQLKGIVPPTLYMDGLMRYLKRDYYIGLLSAAAIYGSSHNASQIFTVITDLPQIRNGKREQYIRFISRGKIPNAFVREIKTETGFVKVSSPELTASDLFHYTKQIGGLGIASTALNDLAEVLDFKNLDTGFFKCVSATSIQRLGYVLDCILDRRDKADMLFNKAFYSNVNFQNIPLAPKRPVEGKSVNGRWKVVINTEIEIDE